MSKLRIAVRGVYYSTNNYKLRVSLLLKMESRKCYFRRYKYSALNYFSAKVKCQRLRCNGCARVYFFSSSVCNLHGP